MIRESLQSLLDSNLDFGDIRKTKIKGYLDNLDEKQLEHLMTRFNGLIANDIYINFYPNIGFRCSNDEQKTGKLPICNIIQKRLNQKYQELL